MARKVNLFVTITKETRKLSLAIREQTKYSVLQLLNERFQALIVQNASVRSNADALRYYDAYWNLQIEQFYLFRQGMVPLLTFQHWLMCRYRDYNIQHQVERSLNVFGDRSIGLTEDEIANATTEQIDFQKSWIRATRYLNDRTFIEMMEPIMNAGSIDHAEELVLESCQRFGSEQQFL